MRSLLSSAVLIAAICASPLAANAQTGDESDSSLEPGQSESVAAPEEPAMKLELDSAGIGVTSSQPRTPDGFTLEQLDRKVRNAKIGVGVSVPLMLAGTTMTVLAASGSICISFGSPCQTPNWVAPVGISGGILALGGLVGMIASSVLLRRAKQKRKLLIEESSRKPRSARWDLESGRLLF